MTPVQAEEMVRAVLHEVAPDADLDALRDDSDLCEALGLDWLDLLQVVQLLSERFPEDLDIIPQSAHVTVTLFSVIAHDSLVLSVLSLCYTRIAG